MAMPSLLRRTVPFVTCLIIGCNSRSSPTPGSGGDVAACGDLTYGRTMQLAPAAATDHYLRCETRGPEAGSHAILSPAATRVAMRRLVFAPDGGQLLVDNSFWVGDSNSSLWIYVHDLTSGANTDLFKAWDSVLTGVAVTRDGAMVALAETAGGSAGLNVFRTDTGAPVAVDPAFVGTVFYFSHDATQLYTSNAGNVTVLATSGLHVIRTFAWPASAAPSHGVSPEDDLVTSSNAPPLASLGTTMDSKGEHPAPGEREPGTTSQDGSIALSTVFVIHTHATDYTSAYVTQTATG